LYIRTNSVVLSNLKEAQVAKRRAAGPAAEVNLQERMIALIRAFGLHKPEETSCGRPVSVAEAHALIELSRGEPESPMVQKELASRLRLEKSTVSRLVGMLEDRGWVERSRSLQDGRAVELRLTGAGKRTAEGIAEARRAKFTRVLEAIPKEERKSVLESMRILEEAMSESE
jgi:DNA-binding MarR family transcriptional regulator